VGERGGHVPRRLDGPLAGVMHLMAMGAKHGFVASTSAADFDVCDTAHGAPVGAWAEVIWDVVAAAGTDRWVGHGSLMVGVDS
jgi:hypothetical protein